MYSFLHPNYHNRKKPALSCRLNSFLPLFSFVVLLIGIQQLVAQSAPSPIIKKNALWHYYDDGSLEANSWYLNPVNESWKIGKAPLGYNVDSLATQLSYGDDSQNKRMVYYFKKTFFVNQPEKYIAYLLNIRRDDGVIVYINDEEVGRQNMPVQFNESVSGENIKQAVLAVTKYEESLFYPMFINSGMIKKGRNTISVALYQRSPSSSDVVFDLELLPLFELSAYKDIIESNEAKSSSSKEYSILTTQLALEKANTKHLLLEQNVDYIKLKHFWISGVLLVLLLLSSFFTFSFYKKNKQYAKSIENQEIFIEKSKQERLKSNILNIENSNFLEALQGKLKQLKKERIIGPDQIDALVSRVEERLKSRNDMEELAIHIDSLNTDFSQRLLKAFPNLTLSEVRHCCLIRIQLSTKEISRILHVDPRSIQTARYRIKKKLRLEENENLLVFLLRY